MRLSFRMHVVKENYGFNHKTKELYWLAGTKSFG